MKLIVLVLVVAGLAGGGGARTWNRMFRVRHT